MGLLKFLEDSNSQVQRKAADALAHIGSDVVIPGLLKLLEHSDFNVRGMAADALGNIRSDVAIPGLLKLLEDSDFNVRTMATDTLGKIRSDVAIPGLLKLLEDSYSYVRWRAVDALDKIGSEAAIPGLLKLLEDSHSYMPWKAANALGNIAKQHTEKIVPHLPHLLTLIPSEFGTEIHRLILAIQVACKYYNYSIRQLSLTPESSKTNNSAGQTFNIEKVGNLITGTTHVTGDQIGTQHNIHPKN